MTNIEALDNIKSIYEEATEYDCAVCYVTGADKECLEIAINALKKQIPKKPIGKYTDYKCSVCGRRVRSGKGSSSRQRDNFCQRCGQKLDWSVDSE